MTPKVKKLIYILLLSSLLSAQGVPLVTERMEEGYFTKAKIGFLASTVVFSISGGLVDGWNWRRHQVTGEEADYYNKLWHRVAPVRDLSAISLGATIALDANATEMFDDWGKFQRTAIVGVSDFILGASIRWILFDHFNYMAMGADVPFLHVSDWAKKGNNGIFFDVIASPYTKVGVLILAIIQNYILTMLFG